MAITHSDQIYDHMWSWTVPIGWHDHMGPRTVLIGQIFTNVIHPEVAWAMGSASTGLVGLARIGVEGPDVLPLNRRWQAGMSYSTIDMDRTRNGGGTVRDMLCIGRDETKINFNAKNCSIPLKAMLENYAVHRNRPD